MVDAVPDERDTWTRSAELLHRMHREMVRIRVFEDRVAELLEDEEIRCPTHLYTGQEAVAVGVCTGLRDDDYVLGNHRSHGHYLAKGGEMDALMAELFCRETGCAGGRGGSMHIVDEDAGFLGSVPMVAGTIPVAVGAGLSIQQRGTDQVSVSFFGDSATEEGVFHEAVNFAVLYDLPVVFVCENNQFSSHLRLNRRRSFERLVDLVEGYPMPTKRVDGNDVLEVHQAAREAVRHARKGRGPTFLECVTHRWRGHVGPRYDLDVGIRDETELEYWVSRCPIRKLERHIDGLDGDGPDLEAVWDEVEDEVEEAVEFARDSPEPPADAFADAVFAREVGR